MYREVPGRCPIQNIDYAISVEYVKPSALSNKPFKKGKFKCNYNIYGEKCMKTGSCPIYQAAPDEVKVL